MVMGCSLQKKLEKMRKFTTAIAPTKTVTFSRGYESGYRNAIDQSLEELGKVAQKIREIFAEEEYEQLSREDYQRLKNRVLGLLVEGDE